ncbi:1890_t:CDS:2, partial [Diversispora eburnea]
LAREDLEITSDDYTDSPDYDESVNKITVQDDQFRTPPHQITSNIYNEEISINENILRMYTNDDVMNIRGESGFSKFLSVDDYIKLRSKNPKRKFELPKDWRNEQLKVGLIIEIERATMGRKFDGS